MARNTRERQMLERRAAASAQAARTQA